MKYPKLISACALLSASVGLSLPAMATPTQYEITNFFGSGPATGDFGTVTLTQVGSNVSVDFTPKPCCGLVETGNTPDVLDFYLPGSSSITLVPGTLTTGFTLDNADSTGLTSTGGTYGTGNGNGATGAFNFAIDCPKGGACGTGGGTPYTGSLDFTVANVTVDDFAANGKGFHFAADICDGINALAGSCTGGTPGATGPATDGGGSTPVPEPLTLSLFGAGLAGITAMRRRKTA